MEAMGSVPREMFIEEGVHDRAYDDVALSIGERQTISQPFMVASVSSPWRPPLKRA